MSSFREHKKYYIRTYGCQMNTADSERIAGLLDVLGLDEVDDYKHADVIILNTCSVRQAAEDKVYGWGQKFKIKNAKCKIKNNKPLVLMTGCMVGSTHGERKRFEESELRKRAGFVDYFFDVNGWERQLPILLNKSGLANPNIETCPSGRRVRNPKYKAKRAPGEHAFVKISEGCDNFCSYCVVPYGRGKEVSRPREEILDEINTLVTQGFTHVTLIGQNVNSWDLDSSQMPDARCQVRINSNAKMPFASLLREIHELEGLDKISFMTANPFDFTQDLVDTIALPKVDRYLHMAVQSGSDRVLARMNRKHTIDEYKQLIGKIRASVPEIELGTDIIVGFPGESDEDFEQTCELIRTIGYQVVYIAMYSPRPGTAAAAKFADDVPRIEKKRRHAYLAKLVEETKSL